MTEDRDPGITVFAASSLDDDPAMVGAAIAVVDECAGSGLSITFGAASVGLMGVVAGAAHDRGVHTIGVIPTFLEDREPPHPGCSEVIRVESMAERKERLLATDGLCILPGGFGTLDETFEAFTLKQLGLLDLPIAIVNVERYFDALLAFVAEAEARGSVVLEGRDLFRVFDTATAAVAYLWSPNGGL